MEKILYEALPVLDHGFVIDYMGDDSSIVQSAEFLGKGTKKVSTDEGLIKYCEALALNTF